MIKEAIAVASTIEDAQLRAVQELNAPEGAELQFEVLDYPSKKLFGLFGGSQAKVRAYYELPDAPKPQIKKAVKPIQKESQAKPVKQKKAAPKQAVAQEKTKKAESAVAEPDAIEIPVAAEFLGRIFKALGVEDAKFKFIEEDGDSLRVFAQSNQSTGSVIGRKGETLEAIQTIVRLFINQGAKRYTHITLEVGDYRAKRAEQLRKIAQKTAARVLKTGRNTALDPMSPYERRIIHTAVGEIEGVESHSVGYDDNRKVLITPVGQFEERSERTRGGRDRRGERGRFDRRDGRGERKPPYQAQTPARAPKADSGTAALYGKVEVPARNVQD